MNWFKKWFTFTQLPYVILDPDFCKDKTSEQLIDVLKNVSMLTRSSGNMIVIELFERLIKEKK